MKLIKSKITDSAGYAVAEFAITLPVLLSIFGLGIWFFGVAATQIEIENISNNIGRAIARGESISNFEAELSARNISYTVDQSANWIKVSTQTVRHITFINRNIQLSANSINLSETYALE